MRAKVTHRLPRVGPLCCVPLAARTSHRPNNAKSHTRAGNARLVEISSRAFRPARPGYGRVLRTRRQRSVYWYYDGLARQESTTQQGSGTRPGMHEHIRHTTRTRSGSHSLIGPDTSPGDASRGHSCVAHRIRHSGGFTSRTDAPRTIMQSHVHVAIESCLCASGLYTPITIDERSDREPPCACTSHRHPIAANCRVSRPSHAMNLEHRCL
jgi:hypothetical protein